MFKNINDLINLFNLYVIKSKLIGNKLNSKKTFIVTKIFYLFEVFY